MKSLYLFFIEKPQLKKLMFLLKWKAYNLDSKLIEYSSIWFYNINKNLNKLSTNLKIYIKNSYLRNSVNIKLLSFYLFSNLNWNINSKILNTKSNIIKYKIRKNVPRGLLLFFRNSKNLKFLNFLNFHKIKIVTDTKLSQVNLVGNVNNLFEFSNIKAFIISDKSKDITIKSNFQIQNSYILNFGLNLLFLKKFDVFSKESYLLFNDVKLFNSFLKFNKTILVKVLLNKAFMTNFVINTTINKKMDYKNTNFYNYSNLQLLGKNKQSLNYLKGKIKLKMLKDETLIDYFKNTKFDILMKNTNFLLYNKRVYRLFYFMYYYEKLKQNSLSINFIIIKIIKMYINFFDYNKFNT